MNVDIIIPIYNAYDDLKNCIDSIIAGTDLKNNRLVLVNDCSPDERISVLLDNYKKSNSDLLIEIITNETNLGFVKTSNIGMRYSDNDIILLNSDTVVPENFVEKLKQCAYSQKKVGTVTPLSNNATLVSVPKVYERNEIPKDITINEYNNIIDKCSCHDYPEIPTAHGFCVYITRKALNTVGFFDSEKYGRGYGEENDFSYRCMDYGFKNILCDDVLVYHMEGKSFSGEREKVLKSHLKILENDYVHYYTNMIAWLNLCPIRYIGTNIDYATNINKRTNILILIHDWDNLSGGTTLHVLDLINNMRDKFNFHVLSPVDGGYKLTSYFESEELTLNLGFLIDKTAKYNRYNQKYYEMIDMLIRAFNIKLIHIHHMIGHYFDIIDVAKKYNIKSIITLHDYYCLCPTTQMLYLKSKCCLDTQEKDCSRCLSCVNISNYDIIDDWRLDWLEFLSKFDKIIVPSDDTKKRIGQVYNSLTIDAIEHGVKVDKSHEYAKVPDKTFNIAFIGVICNHKGAQNIKNIIFTNKNKNIKFHIFGSSELEELKKSRSNYIYHGKYKREELYSLLKENNIHLICFMQIWPETYSYTINEAVASGIPIFSLDIGAGAERVKKYQLGWTSPVDTSIDLLNKKLDDIFIDKKTYSEKVENIKSYNIKTVQQMIDEYKEFYTLKSDNKKEIDYDALRFIIKNTVSSSTTTCQAQLNQILSSMKWRIVNKIKVPSGLAKVLKKTLGGILKLVRRK